jgi:hypothetical protein
MFLCRRDPADHAGADARRDGLRDRDGNLYSVINVQARHELGDGNGLAGVSCPILWKVAFSE